MEAGGRGRDLDLAIVGAGRDLDVTLAAHSLDRVFAVSPHVLPHVAWLYESLLTDRADMVPLAGVCGRVALQVRLLPEGLAAIGADKLLLSLVVTQVVLRNKQALNSALRRVYEMPELARKYCDISWTLTYCVPGTPNVIETFFRSAGTCT